jgi:hypothetical protein
MKTAAYQLSIRMVVEEFVAAAATGVGTYMAIRYVLSMVFG